MKLFVHDKLVPGRKIYLDVEASTRLVFMRKRGADFTIRGQLYDVYDVWAEPSSSKTVTGTVAGGLIGALAGPVGILLGSGIGTLFGGAAQEEENRKVNTFNQSRV